MKSDVEKAIEVDTYILEVSGLVKDKRGYNALLNLLSTGELMNDRLGIDDTVLFTMMLNYVRIDYEFIPYGLQLKENAKLNYYHKVMYPPKVEPVQDLKTNFNRNERSLSVGKDEKEGWIRTRFIDKNRE